MTHIEVVAESRAIATVSTVTALLAIAEGIPMMPSLIRNRWLSSRGFIVDVIGRGGLDDGLGVVGRWRGAAATAIARITHNYFVILLFNIIGHAERAKLVFKVRAARNLRVSASGSGDRGGG